MMRKILSVLVLLLVVLMAVPVNTEAKVVTTKLPLHIEYVKINGDKLHENVETQNPLSIDDLEREQEISVTVQVAALGVEVDTNADGVLDHVPIDLEDLGIYASIGGYDMHNGEITGSEQDLEADLEDGHAQTFKFTMKLPYNLDQGDYIFFVRANARVANVDEKFGTVVVGDLFEHTSLTSTKEYAIRVDAKDHSVTIKDVMFSPSSTVKAGTSLLTKVRVKNTGNEDDNEGIQVKVTIPELGLEATDWLEELNEEESSSSEQLWVIVPKCTKAGTYDVKVDVYFEDGDHKASTTKQITVYENENCVEGKQDAPQEQETTVLTVGTATQNVVKGQAGVVYPVTISNMGKTAKTYVVNVDGYQNWGQVSVSPSNVLVVNPGQAVASYVHVAALETATPGEHMFSVVVNSGAEQLEQFVVKANVQDSGKAAAPVDAGKSTSARDVLTVVLIVLIVVLVLLALVIGFNKLRSKNDEDEEDDQTYY